MIDRGGKKSYILPQSVCKKKTYLFLVFGSRWKCEVKNNFRKKVKKSLGCMIVLKQQTQVSTENHPCQASPKSLLTPTAARDNTGHMSDPHRSFRENLASGRHTLTDMKTNSLTGLQNGTYVKHHLRATPYAQHIFKC